MASQQINMTWKEFAKKHPEYFSKAKKKKIPENKMRYMCQCKRGHVFDYRERIKFPINNKHYAPCQGKCPKCGETMFSFIGSGTNVYPIKFNYTG